MTNSLSFVSFFSDFLKLASQHCVTDLISKVNLSFFMDLFTGAGLIQPLCSQHPTNTPTPQHPTSDDANIKEESPAKTIQLPGFQYVIYIDSELEHVRKHYFEMKRIGRGGECELSKELTCRLVRNTVTNMVSVVRASATEDYTKYPAKEDLQSMARRLVSYYPMLSDKLDLQRPWVCKHFDMNVIISLQY